MDLPLLIQFALCPLTLVILLSVTAPYGRHAKKGWGPAIPSRIAWILMELPAVLTITILVLLSGAAREAVVWVPLAFWLFHYGYRTFVFPALMRPSGMAFPVLLLLSGIAFNILNGYNNAGALVGAGSRSEPLFTFHFLAGALIFAAGFLIHFNADRTIRDLRAGNNTGYGIPRGGFFRWVSSPHYLGEIIQWIGWAVMTWSLAGVAFALFTFCNLAPRALSNHRWYREKFADYPAARKALIPGIL